jgi:quercetin dioxygenase-like cupin family protein
MQRWDLSDGSAGGPPRVLFSTADARAVVIDLAAGEELGDHRVRERAMLLILEGRVDVSTGAGPAEECPRGTLLLFEPGEHHAVAASEDARLLLTLAPWPAPDHYGEQEQADPDDLPANATQAPDRVTARD